MPKITRSWIGPVIAVTVGSTWALRSAVGFAHPNYVNPVTLLDWIAVVSFSVALAALAAGAWLIAELAGRGRSVVAAAVILATGGVVAAIANFIEDGLGVKAFGDVFALGLGGVLVGLLALVALFSLARQFVLAALPVATVAGLMLSNEAGGGFLILVAWLAAAQGMRRGSVAASARVPSAGTVGATDDRPGETAPRDGSP